MSAAPDPRQNTSPSSWPGLLAWAIIFLVVAYILYSLSQRESASPAASGARDVQLDIMAKSAVGARQLSPASAGPLVQALDKISRTPRQRIIASIVDAELENQRAALNRLAAIESEKSTAASLTPQQQQDIGALKTLYASGPDSLDAAARDGLIQNYGFAGKLAVSFGRPDSDPLRRQVLFQSRRTALTVVAFETTAALAALAGVVLLIVGIVLLATGILARRFVPQPSAGTVYVEMFAVYLLSYLALAYLIHSLAGSASSLASGYWVLLAVLPISISWCLLRRHSWSQVRTALGWHGGRGWYVEIPMGVVGYLAGLPLIGVGLLITSWLLRFTKTMPTHPIINAPLNTPGEIFQLYFVASFVAPVIEETMFRGALFHHMRRRWNWLISATVVALIFAVIHPQGWATIPVLMSIAIVLAGLREWRGSILAPMTAHALNNGIVMTLLILLMRNS